MPADTVTEEIDASSEEVFALLHDYPKRLEWDTLLSAARLEPPATRAALGVTSICVGKLYLGRLALRTRYVTFRPPRLAAVEMLGRPPFFASFAASIRHEDLSPARSSVVCRFAFTARPQWLRFVLHPIMRLIFRWETRRRLLALRKFFAVNRAGGPVPG